MIDEINIKYVASLVVKILPVLLRGKVSKIKLITVANKIKFPMPLPLKNLKFLMIKTTKIKAIVHTNKNPAIPVSVKISK